MFTSRENFRFFWWKDIKRKFEKKMRPPTYLLLFWGEGEGGGRKKEVLNLFSVEIDWLTVSFTDLDQGSEMSILSSYWPLLRQAPFFDGAWLVAKLGSCLKSINHWQINETNCRTFSGLRWIRKVSRLTLRLNRNESRKDGLLPNSTF